METGISLHKGPVGEPGGGGVLYTRDFERQAKEGSVNRAACSVRGTWMEDSFTGDPEGCVKEGYGNEHLYWSLVLGDIGGDAALLGTLRER